MTDARDAALLRSLPPVITEASRVLVLGTMPGERSLEAREYYAHPRNAFWRLMHDILGVPAKLPYADRIAALLAAGVALWDVIATANRRGSLDAAIREAKPNNFGALFVEFPGIETVLFNGGKAEKLWQRHVGAQPRRIDLRTMPSSSPANARMSYDLKCRVWADALRAKLGRQRRNG